MKTKTIFTLVLIWGATCSLQAAKFRVNNAGLGAHFTTISSAISSSSVLSGDTLFIEASSLHYAGGNVSKKLVIIGPGYFITHNPMTQANPNSATINSSLHFNAGSEGSIIMGMSFVSTLYLNTHNITIKRNYFYNTGVNINIASDKNNTVIIQNYIKVNNAVAACINIESNAVGNIISNNYLNNNVSSSHTIKMYSGAQAEIVNNCIEGNIQLYNSYVYNNIMISGTSSFSSCVVTNNIGNGTQFPLPDNLQNVSMNLVYNSGISSSDGKYKLINDPSNPAIGYGLLGIDCGMFGGTAPYVLSGIPDVPAVYMFFAPTVGNASTGLPTTVKIKSNR